MRYYPDDVLRGDHGHRKVVPEVMLRAGLVVEVLGDGFVGEALRLEQGRLVLRDRRGRERSFALADQGFLVDDRQVRLVPPAAPTSRESEPSVTASGSIAVAGVPARVARGSRIFVEGIHDAEILERVWGDDLRIEGLVVEVLDGIDDLAAVVRAFSPSPERRMGVLVDHLIEGTKEWHVAREVNDPDVLVTGHPYVDVWQAVKPSAVGIDAWPDVPRGVPWKHGVAAALGEDDHRDLWRRVLAAVRVYTDLEPPLVGAVEQLIDFLTEPVI